MLEVFDFARKVARHYTNVLAGGTDRTGKRTGGRRDPSDQPCRTAESWPCATLGNGGYLAGEPAIWARARVVHGGNGYAAGTV